MVSRPSFQELVELSDREQIRRQPKKVLRDIRRLLKLEEPFFTIDLSMAENLVKLIDKELKKPDSVRRRQTIKLRRLM